MPTREPDDGTINIVVACDDAFAQHACVMLVSLLKSNSDRRFDVFVLVPQDFSFGPQLKQLERPDRCTITPLAIDPALVESLLVTRHVSVAAYYRLQIGHVLPERLERVLYLDSDIIVQGDIAELWSTDLGDAIAAAVPEATETADVKQKLGLDAQVTYFNSGVMLIDLARWRSFDAGTKALRFCRDHADRLSYWDQCALNSVLAGHVRTLDSIWNVQAADRRTTLERARIVHFTTRWKPWMYRCDHPLAYRYWELLAETPWRGYRPPDRTPMNVFKRGLRRALPRPLLRALGRNKPSSGTPA